MASRNLDSTPYFNEFKRAVGEDGARALDGLTRVSMSDIRGGYTKGAVGMYDPINHEVAFREEAITPALVGHELTHALQRQNGYSGAPMAKLSASAVAANDCSAEREADAMAEAFARNPGGARSSQPKQRLDQRLSYAKRESLTEVSIPVGPGDVIAFATSNTFNNRFRAYMPPNGWQWFTAPESFTVNGNGYFKVQVPQGMRVFRNNQQYFPKPQPQPSPNFGNTYDPAPPQNESYQSPYKQTQRDDYLRAVEQQTERYASWFATAGTDNRSTKFESFIKGVFSLVKPSIKNDNTMAFAAGAFVGGFIPGYNSLVDIVDLTRAWDHFVNTLASGDAGAIALAATAVLAVLIGFFPGVGDFARKVLDKALDWVRRAFPTPRLATAGAGGRGQSRMRMDGNGNGGGRPPVRAGFRYLRDGTAAEAIAHGAHWGNIRSMVDRGMFFPDSGGLCFFTKQFDQSINQTFKHGVDRTLGCSFAFKGTVDASGKRILKPDASSGGFTDVAETLVVETNVAIPISVNTLLIRGRQGEGTRAIHGSDAIAAALRQIETRGAAYINELFGRH